jgi:thiosulfate/3-mercaptopyruvate sulfurtransferase
MSGRSAGPPGGRGRGRLTQGDTHETLFRAAAALALVCAGLSARAVELPGPVVDAAWLAGHLNDVQVVEVRSDVASFGREPVFETDKKTGKKMLSEVGGHLPGARLVDFKVVRTERQVGDRKIKYLIPEQADFQARMQAAGVMADQPIVLVPVGQDIAEIDEALRLYWSFKVYGEDRWPCSMAGRRAGWPMATA